MAELGPRGGDVTNPQYKPEWRTKHLDVNVLPNGEMGLHRFAKDQDVAANGKKNEQPWHRMAAYMLNAGRTNSEIALAAGVTAGTVSQLRMQRWFQELCATIANTEGGEILGLLRSEAQSSVNKLVELRDFAESERVQLTAAQILLEQSHGKPIQKNVSIVGHSRLSPEDEYAELTAELQRLRSLSPAPALPDRKET